jgi:Domain of unknown function (DUF4272)
MDADDEHEEDVPRTAVEIARRAIALHCVIAAAHDVDRTELVDWLKHEALWDAVSPWEQQFLLDNSPSDQDVRNAGWRVEAQVALLWAIGKIQSLGSLSEQCDTTPMVDAIPDLDSSTAAFIDTSVLRSSEEISEEYEKVYQAHWETRNAARHNIPIPDGMDSGVVQERHYGFNWLIGYCGQEWDEVSTDT